MKRKQSRKSDGMNLEDVLGAYYDKVYSLALFRVGNVRSAEDITREVFSRVVEESDTYKPEKTAFSTWIFTIVLGIIKSFYQRKPTEFYIEDGFNREGEYVALYRAVASLKGCRKEAVLLKYAAGLSNAQVAEILKLSAANVRDVLERAKKDLKIDISFIELAAHPCEAVKKAVFERIINSNKLSSGGVLH